MAEDMTVPEPLMAEDIITPEPDMTEEEAKDGGHITMPEPAIALPDPFITKTAAVAVCGPSSLTSRMAGITAPLPSSTIGGGGNSVG